MPGKGESGTNPAFDTLSAARSLKAYGIESGRAEAIVIVLPCRDPRGWGIGPDRASGNQDRRAGRQDGPLPGLARSDLRHCRVAVCRAPAFRVKRSFRRLD